MHAKMVLPAILKAHLQMVSDLADSGVKSLVTSDAGSIVTLIALVYLSVAVLRLLFDVINFIFVYFVRPGKNLKFYGSWAMVTGATDGIGKAYARELAKRGASTWQ